MTHIPATADELLDLWSGTHAPPEAALEPRRMRIIGSPWLAAEHYDGTWSFLCHEKVVWGPMEGTVDEAFRVLLELFNGSRAETPGQPPEDTAEPGGGDPLAVFVGLAWAAALSCLLWAGGYAVGRWVGWW